MLCYVLGNNFKKFFIFKVCVAPLPIPDICTMNTFCLSIGRPNSLTDCWHIQRKWKPWDKTDKPTRFLMFPQDQGMLREPQKFIKDIPLFYQKHWWLWRESLPQVRLCSYWTDSKTIIGHTGHQKTQKDRGQEPQLASWEASGVPLTGRLCSSSCRWQPT